MTDEEYDIMMGMKLRGQHREAELRALYTGSDWGRHALRHVPQDFLLKIYDRAEPTFDPRRCCRAGLKFPLSTART